MAVKTFRLIAFFAFLLFAVQDSYAGCTLQGKVPGTPESVSRYPYALHYHCVADGINTIGEFSISGWRGYFHGTDVVFTTDKEPTSVTPTVNTYTGVQLLAGTATTNLATGRSEPDTPKAVYDGLKVSQSVTCDATDEWDTYIIFMQ